MTLPSGNKADPDRLAAYHALVRIDRKNAYSNIVLNKVIEGDAVRNPGFVRELTYGTVRNRRYLDWFIGRLAKNGISSVKRELVILLRMGIYQILFMGSVPVHSAVDETVKLAKVLFPGKDGFVNGVLRSFVREQYTEEGKLPVPDIKDSAERLSVMYSCDEGLVKLIRDQYGDEKAEEILRTSLETPPLFIHVNTLKTDADALMERLNAGGFDAEKYSEESLIVSGKGIIESGEFREGLFFVQDASSSDAVAALDPKPGETVIDVCAAPGGKTFAMAVRMKNKGVIHALDLHGNKLKALEKQADRLGIEIIDTEEHDAKEAMPEYRNAADRVLCDVPCSGLGVLRRKPEIKDRPLKEGGRDIAEIQYRILDESSCYVKPRGKLMYSTCTINRTENHDVAERFLKAHPEFRKSAEKQTIAVSGGPDGFYYCVMDKIDD